MGYYLKPGELERIRVCVKDTGSRMGEFFRALSDQADSCIGMDILDHAGMEWWYYIDRLPNAAIVYAIEPREALGSWIHESVLKIAEQPVDAWVGPWIRRRTDPLQGQLETSIICIALTMAVELTESLFTQQELKDIHRVVEEKGLTLLRTRLEHDWANGKSLHNQFAQVLAGTSAAAAFLDRGDLFPWIREMYDYISQIYNADSYGEGLNYWEYASQHMVLIREFAARYHEKIGGSFDAGPYCGSLGWAAASFLHHKHVPGFEDQLYPISLNISDSGYIKRLPAVLLLGIAKEKDRSQDAALARWMFEIQYPEGMMTFRTKQMGFMDEISYWCLLFYDEAAEPCSPEQLGFPLCKHYENGQFIMRSGWQEGATVLAGMGGWKQLCTSFHRHRDCNSFLLNYRKEMLFVDPGHCCYRLDEFSLMARRTHTHNAVILMKNGSELLQKSGVRAGNCNNSIAPYCETLRFSQENGMTVYTSDAKNAYESTVKMAKRSVVLVSPRLVLIRDDVQTDEPVQTLTRFHLNNWNNELRYVLNNDGVCAERNGVKFGLVQLFCNHSAKMTRKWGIMHLSYHPEPNQGCQGREGSTVDIDYTAEETTEHSAVYAILLDDGWEVEHYPNGIVLTNGTERITVKSNERRTQIETASGIVTI